MEAIKKLMSHAKNSGHYVTIETYPFDGHPVTVSGTVSSVTDTQLIIRRDSGVLYTVELAELGSFNIDDE